MKKDKEETKILRATPQLDHRFLEILRKSNLQLQKVIRCITRVIRSLIRGIEVMKFPLLQKKSTIFKVLIRKIHRK
jgi:hypothetical protein